MTQRYERRLIHEEEDDFGMLEVVEDDELRALHFGTPHTQSSMRFDAPAYLTFTYHQIMALSVLFCGPPRDVMIMGLGGGSLPKFFLEYYPDCNVYAAEIRPRVIDLAKQYFGLPEQHKRLHIECGDAFAYLMKEERQYDIIMIDIYSEDAMSESVSEDAFFECCQRSLREGGVLCWNLWSVTPMEIVKRCIGRMAAAFGGNLFIVPVPEEWLYMVMVFQGPVSDEQLESIEAGAARLSEQTANDFSALWADLRPKLRRPSS